MKKLIMLLVMGLFLTSLVSSLELYERFETGGDNAATSYGVVAQAQNFTIGNTGPNQNFVILNVSLKIYRTGGGDLPGQINVFILGTTASGNPNPVDIKTSGFIDGDTITATSPGAWYNISMNSSSFQVTPDTEYFIMVNASSGDLTNRLAWRQDESVPTYTGGKKTETTDAGATWIESPRDQLFRIWGGNSSADLTVTLLNPLNQSTTNSINVTFNGTIGVIGGANVTNTTLRVWYTNGTFFGANTTLHTGNTSFNETWSLDGFGMGDFVWNVEAIGNSTPLNSINATAPQNFSFSWVPFIEDNQVFNSHTYETNNDTFYINITTDESVSNIGAFLVHNGTFYPAEHTCVGGVCQLEREIDIPINNDQTKDSENKSFYWSVTLFGTFGTFTGASSPNQQNISKILLQDGIGGADSVTFNMLNESDRVSMKTDIDATFEFWLGDGTVTKFFNKTFTGSDSYTLQINHNLSYMVNSDLQLTNGTNLRNYYLYRESYDNITTLQTLLVPNESETTNIVIQIKDQGLVPLEGYWVKIYRYYPEINQYLLTGARLTDEFGQFVTELVTNKEKYRFEFYDEDKVLRKTSDKLKIRACSTTVCILPFIIEAENEVFSRYSDIPLFDFNLIFNNVTNTFTYSWDDQTLENSIMRLEVTRFSLNQSTTVCNESSSSSVAAINCGVGSGTFSYSAKAFRSTNNGQTLMDIINLKVGDMISTFGVEGLLWVFLLAFTGLAIGIYNPSVGAVLYGVGFVFMGLLGVVSMPLPVFFANTLLVVIFIWAVRT